MWHDHIEMVETKVFPEDILIPLGKESRAAFPGCRVDNLRTDIDDQNA